MAPTANRHKSSNIVTSMAAPKESVAHRGKLQFSDGLSSTLSKQRHNLRILTPLQDRVLVQHPRTDTKIRYKKYINDSIDLFSDVYYIFIKEDMERRVMR